MLTLMQLVQIFTTALTSYNFEKNSSKLLSRLHSTSILQSLAPTCL